jgi:hypothetical protein
MEPVPAMRDARARFKGKRRVSTIYASAGKKQNAQVNWRACEGMEPWVAAPTVEYASIEELWALCNVLLDAYAALTRREVDTKLATRSNSLAWTEYDRLILGLTDFDGLMEDGMPIVLASTKAHTDGARAAGTPYARHLNRRIASSLNFSNSIFFHRTSSGDVEELHASNLYMLERILLTSAQSHFQTLVKENFASPRSWDGDEWLLCPKHKLREYTLALLMSQHRRAGKDCLLYLLPEDVLIDCLQLVGICN